MASILNISFPLFNHPSLGHIMDPAPVPPPEQPLQSQQDEAAPAPAAAAVQFKKRKKPAGGASEKASNLRRKKPEASADAEGIFGGDEETGEDVGGAILAPSAKRLKRKPVIGSSTSSGASSSSSSGASSSASLGSSAAEGGSEAGSGITLLSYTSERSVAMTATRQKAEAAVELDSMSERNPTRNLRGHSWIGPTKATSNYRTISRFDYQPDICKDWKETGYCGYGDSCKFLHDRSDYKSGWQLEREWHEEEKRKQERAKSRSRGGQDLDSDDDAAPEEADEADSLPFACSICRGDFDRPVVTRCEHYFCEPCALKLHKTDRRCAVCREPTMGIFNPAKKIIANLEKLKARREAMMGPADSDEEQEVEAEADAEDGKAAGAVSDWQFQ